MKEGAFHIGLKTLIVFLFMEMVGKVIPNGKNYMSKGRCRKHEGLPGKLKQSNVADLKRCPWEKEEINQERQIGTTVKSVYSVQ